MNLTPSKFPLWGAAVARVKAGSGAPARIAFIGDSITEGTGAGSFQGNYVQVLKPLLNARYQSVDGSIFGLADDYNDARVGMGTGWGVDNPLESWGPRTDTASRTIWAPNTATGDLTFTFPQSFDRIRVIYPTLAGLGTFTVNVDGGASLGTVVTGFGAAAVAATTFSCAAGTHVIHITPPTVGAVFILGVEVYTSTSPDALLANGGSGGTTTAMWTTTASPWNRLPFFDNYPADLYVIMLGTNDTAAAVSGATFEANLTTIVTKAQLYGDVLLMSCVPCSDATQAARLVGYITNAINVATAKNCGLYDVNALFVDYATANAAGRMFDVYHPNGVGYSYLANNLSPALLALG